MQAKAKEDSHHAKKLSFRVKLFLFFINLRDGLRGKKEADAAEIRLKSNAGMTRLQGRAPALYEVRDEAFPGPAGKVPVRIYRPSDGKDLPCLLFFHGGGYTIGNIDTYQTVCAKLAKESGAVVISTDYRLAPEHPFPAAVEDGYAVLCRTAESADTLGIDRGRIAVCGDSAGGNLSAVLCLKSRDEGGPVPALQVLLYPSVNISDTGTESFRRFGKGYLLTTDDVLWFRPLYLPDAENYTHPYASPYLAGDHSGLPPALIITAGFDVLHDEGRAYAEKLKDAGVETEYVCFQRMIHGFVSIERFLPEGREAISLIAEKIRTLLRSSRS
jgi:acetyl esterase